MAILIIAGAAAVLVMNNPSEEDDGSLKMTHRLMVMGNVCSDDKLDSHDVDVLQAVVDGKSAITIKGEEIDLTAPELTRYADVNQDGKVNSKDVSDLKDIIDGKVKSLFYENAKGEIKSVKVPINNLVVMFRRVATTVVMVGATDMVRGYISDLSSTGNYGFLNLPGKNIGTGSDPDYEAIKQLNTTYASTGGVTLIADATGAASNIEEKVGSGIDVIRMPVTEMGKSENGVVTLAYLLGYNNSHKSTIEDRLDKWVAWNDDAKEKIQKAVAKLEGSKKTTGVIGMWNASAGTATINIRGPGVSEYEYTKMCGCDNITPSSVSYSMKDLNEYLISAQPEVLMIMQQEVFLLKNHVSVETTYAELMESLTPSFHGKVGMFSQFFGTGPAYILSLMYYSTLFIPELKDAFDIQKEYEYFLETFLGDKSLASIPAFLVPE